MSDDDGTIYMPTKQEYILTGIFGIGLYSVILYLSIASAWVGFKSKSTRRFFGSIGLMALLEIPRYFDLAIDASYTSRICYSFHIIAGIFFFLGFSIVCRQWSGLLQLGSYFRMVYGYHGLIISNVSFAVIDFVAIVFCLMSGSLDGFFFSVAFVVITLVEGIRNSIYSGFLTYYGLKLVKRFWHFSRLERQVSRRYCCYISDDQVFTRVVLRLTGVLFLTTLCFVFRMTMLVAKMAELHSPKELTSPSFPLFGFWWFTFSDFIPRAVPSLAFIFLMRTKKPARDQVTKGLNHADRAYDNNAFQFVRLEAANDRDDAATDGRQDDFPRSYSFSGYSDDGISEIDFQINDHHDVTKSILHHDHLASTERQASTESLGLTSFRDLQRAATQTSAHPAGKGNSTTGLTRFDALTTLNYSDDEADYETVAAAGDDDEEEEDIAGDKAIDSLLNLLTYTTGASNNNSQKLSVASNASSRSGSYSAEAVAHPPPLPSSSTYLTPHASLSSASIAAAHAGSANNNANSSLPNSRATSISEPMKLPPPVHPTGDMHTNDTSSSTPAAGKGRGLGAAIKKMQMQQQQQQQSQKPSALTTTADVDNV